MSEPEEGQPRRHAIFWLNGSKCRRSHLEQATRRLASPLYGLRHQQFSGFFSLQRSWHTLSVTKSHPRRCQNISDGRTTMRRHMGKRRRDEGRYTRSCKINVSGSRRKRQHILQISASGAIEESPRYPRSRSNSPNRSTEYLRLFL